MRINSTIVLFLLCTVSFYKGSAQSVVTINSLLKEMTDFDAIVKFPSPSFTLRQASSYDRRSVSPEQPGWFANGDFNQ